MVHGLKLETVTQGVGTIPLFSSLPVLGGGGGWFNKTEAENKKRGSQKMERDETPLTNSIFSPVSHREKTNFIKFPPFI